MNFGLQIKMIVLSILFFLFITYFVRKKQLQIKHSLVWYFASVVLVFMAFFPNILYVITNWFGIIEPTNSVFMIIIAFLLLIVFLNNITICKHQKTITLLVQEISLLKSESEEKKQ